MKTIWFKKRYVHDICVGTKTDTIRRPNKQTPKPGETIAFSVGPRPPFAKAFVESVTSVAELTLERRRDVEDCLGEVPDDAICIMFSVTDILE